MQALIEFIAGLIALLAVAVLSQFGVDMNRAGPADREVRRVSDCVPPAPTSVITVQHGREC